MQYQRPYTRAVASVVAFFTIIYTVPLSAADLPVRTGIGSVSAVGAVDLRGVRVSGDGTLFSGDRLNVGAGAYARVALGSGPKVEVEAGSDVTVTRDGETVQVRMASGNIAFTANAKSPLVIRVGDYEVQASGDASGNIAFVGSTAFGVRVMSGSVRVRHTRTRQSFSVQKGSDRIVGLQAGTVSEPLSRLVSATPAAVPAPPQTQTGMTKGSWIAVLGTVAGATAAIIVLATKNDDSDDDAATRLAQIKALQNVSAMTASSTSTGTLATTVNTTAGTARTAINNSNVANKAALLASADAVIAKVVTANGKLATLNAALTTLQNTLSAQSGPPTSAQQQQLTQLYNDLISAQADANSALSQLLTLLSQATAAGVTGVPPAPNSQPVQPPVLASASVPV